MKLRLLQVALVASAMSGVPALGGCGGNVVVDQAGATGGTGNAGGTGANGTGAATTGVGGTGGTTTGVGGTGAGGTGGAPSIALITPSPSPVSPCYANPQLLPPDPVFLLVASDPLSCAETLPPGLDHMPDPPHGHVAWELCLSFPSSALATGTLIEVPSPGVTGFEIATNGGTTSGTIVSGPASITFASVDTTQAMVSLQGTNELLSFGNIPIDPDGSYLAPRCP